MTDFGGPRKHAATHQSGGSDEISLAGMTPGDHAARHQSGGADEIDATGLTGVPVGAILGDATEGRKLRACYVTIQDGTNANTLKCTLSNHWNGDALAAVDNIAKDSTGTYYSLSATGTTLTILHAAFTGNALYAIGVISINYSGTAIHIQVTKQADGIRFICANPTTGAGIDLTGLVDVGDIYINFLYLTDA